MPESMFSAVAIAGIITMLVSLLPSLIVIVITSTWSCAVFKKYYIGGNDQLNRRMLSLSIITPLVLLASSMVKMFLLILVGDFLFSLSLGEYFPYWIVFAHVQLTAMIKFLSRLVYPIVLTYSHISLNCAVKDLLKKFKFNNSVSPET